MTSNHHILSSLSTLGWFLVLSLLFEVAITFSSHEHVWFTNEVMWPETKNSYVKTQAAWIFLWWNKCQRVECIDMQKNRRVDLLMTSLLFRQHKSQPVLPFCQFLHLNALYPLAKMEAALALVFLFSGHITNQIWSWLPKVMVASNRRKMTKN